MSDLAGVFNPAARAAIIETGWGRCIGCGRPDVTTQHRRARGMGGTSDLSIGHPANGVPLCGSGTTGCHGFTEHHPRVAALLGWRLTHGEAALTAPWWHRTLGWVRWVEEPDGFVGIVFVHDVDRLVEREAAHTEFTRWLDSVRSRA